MAAPVLEAMIQIQAKAVAREGKTLRYTSWQSPAVERRCGQNQHHASHHHQHLTISKLTNYISAVAEAAQKFRSACQVLFRHSWWQETGWSTLPRLQLMRTGSRSKDRILLQHSVVNAFVNASATKLWRQVPKTFEHRRQHSCTWARFRLPWSW